MGSVTAASQQGGIKARSSQIPPSLRKQIAPDENIINSNPPGKVSKRPVGSHQRDKVLFPVSTAI